tara:strand:- start:2295 stop:3488 length:1194 start_codon:yes stop_codon:yes gene_type:complete
MASIDLQAKLENNVIPLIAGGTWLPASGFHKKIIGASTQCYHRVGHQVYLSQQKSNSTAIPLFAGFEKYVTELDPESNFIVTILLDRFYVSCKFFNEVPTGEEIIHTSTARYQTWLSKQAEDVLYWGGELVKNHPQDKTKTIHKFELSDVVSNDAQIPLEAAQYINFKQLLIVVSTTIVMAAAYLIYTTNKAAEAEARLKEANVNVNTGVMDTDHFMSQCLKNLDFSGPRTYGFEIKERGCFANANEKFPKETSAAVIQILKPTGDVDVFLASQLSAKAFDKWPYLKAVNVGEIISGVSFDVTYKPTQDLDILSGLNQIHGKLFKVLSSNSGSFSTEKEYRLDTSFNDVVERLSGLRGFDIVSIVEKISSGKTTITLVLKSSEVVTLDSDNGKINDT